MKKYLLIVWRYWCGLWQFDWPDSVGMDYHKWESKMEIHRRLASPRQRHP